MYHTRSQVLLQVLWSFYIFFFSSFNFDPSLKLLQILFLGYMFDGWDFFFLPLLASIGKQQQNHLMVALYMLLIEVS